MLIQSQETTARLLREAEALQAEASDCERRSLSSPPEEAQALQRQADQLRKQAERHLAAADASRLRMERALHYAQVRERPVEL